MKRLVLFMWLLVPAIGMAQEMRESGRGQEVEVGRDSLRGSNGTGEDRKGSEREEKLAERKERRKFVWGGEREVRAFEFEAGLGVRGGTDRMGADRREAGLVMFVEVRHNYNRRFDFGVQFYLGTHDLIYDDFNYSGKTERFVVRQIDLLPVVDYNFRQGRRVSPFVGAGIGLAITDIDYRDERSTLCLMPRAGVELWRHLRVTVDYRWAASHDHGAWNDYGSWNACVGVVFGGGRKRN